MFTIQFMKARQIFDGLGDPTVEVDIGLSNGAEVSIAMPSGASTVCGAAGTQDHKSKNGSHLVGIEFPECLSFNAVTAAATTGQIRRHRTPHQMKSSIIMMTV
ncbi:hypothetical protein VitviT2T_023566 [Vitis vinifera]|nr:hypothetical protein VitviT2T_023566 [Vitis vinifera]